MYNKISRKFKKCTRILAALVFLFAFFLSNPKAYADDLSEVIRISQKISINSPYAKPQDSFTYILESVSKDAPLPEEASGSYKFSLRGDETKDLSIKFTKAGEYTYKLYQEKSDIKNVTQDKEVYTIIIKIGQVNGELVKEMILIKNSSNKKIANIEFHNIYEIEDDNPDKPANPDDPEKPEKPEVPENPAKPGKPDNPAQPENPEKPENPENPNKPEKPTKPQGNRSGTKTKTKTNVKTGIREIGMELFLIMLFAILALKLLSKKRSDIGTN